MEEAPPPLNKFTRAGRMLVLSHLLLAIGGSALYIGGFLPGFPAGSYPIMMFVVPVALACFILFLVLSWALERLGIQIYRR
jgi:hypothetical protein